MRTFQFFVIAIAAFTTTATASEMTLCNPKEVVYFSCKIKNSEKIVSLCGSKYSEYFDAADKLRINNNVWFQYRFGAPGKVELAYPEQKKESLKKFKAAYTKNLPGTTSSIFFVNNGIVYSVDVWEILIENDDNSVIDNSFYGVVVMDEPSFFGRSPKSDQDSSKKQRKMEVRLPCAIKPTIGPEYGSVVFALDINK